MANYKSLPTEELMVIYQDALGDFSVPSNSITAMHHELLRRRELHPEAFAIYEELFDADEQYHAAPTPSYHGELCRACGAGCDECDFYIECFPDWREMLSN